MSSLVNYDQAICVLLTYTFISALSKTTAGKQGIVKYLLECLEKEISDRVQLKCLICLSDIVHENGRLD